MADEQRRLELRLRAQLLSSHLQQQLEAAERLQARHDDLFVRVVCGGETEPHGSGEQAERESRIMVECAATGSPVDAAIDATAASGGLAAAEGREGELEHIAEAHAEQPLAGGAVGGDEVRGGAGQLAGGDPAVAGTTAADALESLSLASPASAGEATPQAHVHMVVESCAASDCGSAACDNGFDAARETLHSETTGSNDVALEHSYEESARLAKDGRWAVEPADDADDGDQHHALPTELAETGGEGGAAETEREHVVARSAARVVTWAPSLRAEEPPGRVARLSLAPPLTGGRTTPQSRSRASAPGSALAGDAAAGGHPERGAVAVDARRDMAEGKPNQRTTAPRQGMLESGGTYAAAAHEAVAVDASHALHQSCRTDLDRLTDEEEAYDGEHAASSDENAQDYTQVQPTLEWINWMGPLESDACDHGAAVAGRKAATLLRVKYPKKLRAKQLGGDQGHACRGTIQRADGQSLANFVGLGKTESEAINDCHGQLFEFLYVMLGTGIGLGLGGEYSEADERAFVSRRAQALRAATAHPEHMARRVEFVREVGHLDEGRLCEYDDGDEAS